MVRLDSNRLVIYTSDYLNSVGVAYKRTRPRQKYPDTGGGKRHVEEWPNISLGDPRNIPETGILVFVPVQMSGRGLSFSGGVFGKFLVSVVLLRL